MNYYVEILEITPDDECVVLVETQDGEFWKEVDSLKRWEEEKPEVGKGYCVSVTPYEPPTVNYYQAALDKMRELGLLE